MIFQIADVLTPDEVAEARAKLGSEMAGFASGKANAGWYVNDHKHNAQANGPAALQVIPE